MPTFYFHLESGELELDDEGTEFSTIADARHEALILLADVLRNGAGEMIWRGHPLRLWVTDGPSGAGDTLFNIEVVASRRP
jgi:hypothetical protein